MLEFVLRFRMVYVLYDAGFCEHVFYEVSACFPAVPGIVVLHVCF